MRNEYAVIIIIAVFLGTFFAAQYFKQQNEYVVDGIRIISNEKPKEAIGRIAAKADLLMALKQNDTDSSNPCVIAMGSEITKELASVNRTPAIYAGYENSRECQVFGNKTTSCPDGTTNGLISVEIGECNCMKIEKNMIAISGNKQFMCDGATIKKIAGVIRFAVGG